MDIIKLASDALKPLSSEGIPVQQGWYDEDISDVHVTLWNLGSFPEAYSDDEVEIIGADVQVTIFSPKDEVSLAKRIRRLMRSAGFTWTSEEQDNIQFDGELYMKPQRFHYSMEVTEE